MPVYSTQLFFPLPLIKRKDSLVEAVAKRGEQGYSGHFRTCHQQTDGLSFMTDSWPDNRRYTLGVTT
jgi:hypothetical protein